MKSADGRFTYLDLSDIEVPDGTSPEGIDRVGFQCRRYPNNRCTINLRGRGHDAINKSWTWDGNVDHPTLVPSINCRDCWHGFIEKGIFLTTNKTPESKQ